jgi:signal transduction histidine kinase
LREAHASLERRVASRTEELTQRTEELERLNAALHRARREAEDASRVKSHFLAAASHDLRQPFQAMRLFCDLAKAQNTDAKLAPALNGICTALAAGEELLGALLEVSALDSGVVQPSFEDVDLAVVVADLAAEVRVLTDSKGLRLAVRACPVVVRSDRALLKRALRNLLQNAIRYTSRGGILISCRRTFSGAAISVSDTGIGIAAENLDAIFRDFYQIQNSERDRAKGLGLGLPVVRRMVTLLGHSIEVRSRPGRGSVFTLRFTRP